MKHCFVFAFGGKNLIRKLAAFLSLRGMNPRDIRKGGVELFEVAYFRGLSFFEILEVWGILFLSGFFSRTFTIHKTAGEGEGYFFNSFLPLPPTSQTLRHKPTITAESSILHIASSRNKSLNTRLHIFLKGGCISGGGDLVLFGP